MRLGQMQMSTLMPLSTPLRFQLSAGLLGAAVALCGAAAFASVYGYAQPPRTSGPADIGPRLTIHPGLEIGGGGVLTSVVPGGPAWTLGLRSGWTADPLLAAETGMPDAVAACGPTDCVIYHDQIVYSALARRFVFESLAVVVCVAALVIWRRRPPLSGLLALAAIAVSAPTYGLIGNVPLFPALYMGSLVAPALWLRLASPHRLWNWLLPAALGVGLLWTVTWLADSHLYGIAEGLRILAIVGIVAAGIMMTSGAIAFVDRPMFRDRTVDTAVGLVIGGSSLAAWWFGVVPGWLAATFALIATVAYISLGQRIRGLLARVTFAEQSQRATMFALEAERSRVARDLHDVPLQELTAIIHQLDRRLDTASEAARLREIAGHLREVSVSLRPPLLDDVGLGAALAELADRHALNGGAPVLVSVADETRISPSSRPPGDVELAVYRIVQEALNNAQSHARPNVIEVEGIIHRDHVEVTVRDDGPGIEERAVALARRSGRLGLTSMHERAHAIGANLVIEGRSGGRGTSVAVTWGSL